MREDELRAAAVCVVCNKPFGHAGPLFWRISLERHGVDRAAVTAQDGLTAMLGGHAGLARIMGPDRAMTQVLASRKVTVCENCAAEPVTVYALGLGDDEGDASEGEE